MKQILLVCALLVLSTNVFASKARMIALGEDEDGSFYISDVRNVFFNPAEVNNFKDLVTMEWGAADVTVSGEKDNQPNTEAGIFHDGGQLIYGAYLGSRANKFTSKRTTKITSNFNDADFKLQAGDTLDLFIAGNAGMKWGASVTYSSTSNEVTTKNSEQSLTVLKLGIMKESVGGFIHYSAQNEANNKVASQKFEMDSDVTVGLHMDRGSYRYYFQYRGYEVDAGEEFKGYELGITRTKNINEKAKLFTKTSIYKEDVKDADERTALGITVGIEVDAKEWLALRASISQSVYDESESAAGKKTSTADTTNVNTGASFKFGDLSVDGLIGTGDGTGAAGTSTTEKGVLSLSNLMTRVSLTYKY